MTQLINNKNRRSIISQCLNVFHKSAIYPRRMTWIRQNHCYICDVTGTEPCATTYLKNADRRRLVGYITCSKCAVLLPTIFNIYEESGEYVPNSIYSGYVLSPLAFLRQSLSNPNLPIYIERGASIKLADYTPLMYIEKRVRAKISWVESDAASNMVPGGFEKSIFLANLIFHNRRLYGKAIEDGPLSRCTSFWRKPLQNEYNKANQFMQFLLCMDINKTYGPKVDKLIENRVFLFWRGELI